MEKSLFFVNLSPVGNSSRWSKLKTGNARIAQLVERNLAKVEVAGSNPVSRSGLLEWWNGRHAGLKILWALARAGSSPASSTKK